MAQWEAVTDDAMHHLPSGCMSISGALIGQQVPPSNGPVKFQMTDGRQYSPA
jgi:hypothetical protein